ncbi:DUF6146 family protein [Mesonia sp.]|uniref:DUF6146 family protein n=1 Tax=Mesonia sp. TaxID=1960830 RepID=UPI003F97959E
MKNIFFLCILLITLYSCSSTSAINQSHQEVTSQEINDTLNDSLTYQVIMEEPGFNSWLKKQQPKSYYELSFLENKNVFFATSYNNRVDKENYNKDLYPWEINYDPNLTYGLEVNYSLYQYFLYFQEKYKQTL